MLWLLFKFSFFDSLLLFIGMDYVRGCHTLMLWLRWLIGLLTFMKQFLALHRLPLAAFS